MPASPRHILTPTLGLYLGGKFLWHVVLVTIVLSGITLVLDGVELSRRISTREVADGAFATLLLMKTPSLLLQSAPFAILLGTILCFSRLTKDHELTAVRASGLPARLFLVGPLLVCLGIGLFNLTILNPFAATTQKSYEKIYNTVFPGSAKGLVTKGGQIWLRQESLTGETIIYANKVAQSGQVLEDTMVLNFDINGVFQERLDAEKMTLTPGEWELSDVVKLEEGTAGLDMGTLHLPTSLTPAMIQNSFTSPHTLSVWGLPKFINLLKQTGFPVSQHLLHFHLTLAGPALALAMFLLAAPFALHFSRSGHTAALMAMGVGFGFVFYFFSNFMATFGLSGRVDVAIAAWMPTLIAALLGLALFLHFREE